MNCSDMENMLYGFVAEHLKEEERKSAEEHLKACNNCKDKLNTVKETLPLLDYWSPPRVSADFEDRVLGKIFVQKKSLWQKIMEKVFSPPHIKVPLEGLAVTGLIFLVIMLQRGAITPEVEEIPRELPIETQVVEAKQPIILQIEDIDSTFTRLIELIKENNGHLVRRRPVEAGMEVTFRLEKDKEEFLFNALKQLGKLKIEKEGYKDAEGNIVVILTERL